MRRETIIQAILLVVGTIVFTATLLAIPKPKELELWEFTLLAIAISIFVEILFFLGKPNRKPETIVIKVKAWDNEDVRIRALTASEEVEVMRLQLVNRWGDTALLTAHYAMVEQKMSYREIIVGDYDKFEGIQEIAEAAEGMARGERERL